MRSIGEVARASGLSVSALRFYDNAGVLVPAEVRPDTGYRRYADDQVRSARLIAGLRRVGMPVAEIAEAVRSRPAAVREMLARHRRRLEDGLADARRELLRLDTLLDLEENLMTRITLPAAALAAALDAVRFAASTDPEFPVLGGVLFDVDTDALTLVTTDRFRIAVATAPAAVDGPPVRPVLPLSLVDEIRPLLSGTVVLDLTDDRARVEAGGRSVDGTPLDLDFPDHRRALAGLGDDPRRLGVDTATLRAAVTAAPALTREHEGSTYPVVVLDVSGTDVRVAAPDAWVADTPAHVAVNREFLLAALDAGGAGQLVLELDGPIRPLAFRVPGDRSRFSVLMPVSR